MKNPFENLVKEMLLLKTSPQKEMGFPTSLVLVPALSFMAQSITTAYNTPTKPTRTEKPQ